jgi:predicted phage terminase large subunit-like protein
MSVSPQEAAFELLTRRRARSGLLEYIRYTNPQFKVSAFSETVCAALDKFMVDVQEGKRPVLILQAPPQHGKELEDSTPMLTSEGWKTHGELTVGSKLFAPDGSMCSVIGISQKYPANCRVEMTDGSVFYCHENHDWLVISRDYHRELVMSGREMMKLKTRTNPLLCSGVEGARGSRFNFQLPLVNPIIGIEKELPVAPYTLGAWLGDGTRTAAKISSDWKDVKVAQGIIDDGYPIKTITVHRTTGVLGFTFHKLWEALKSASLDSKGGTWKPKRIPDDYLTASIFQRLELLAGLIDTDGYLYQKNGRVVFTTSERELADSFCQLVATFGWRSTLVTEQPRLSSSGIQYVIGFNPTLHIPCRLDRKKTVRLSKPRRIAIRSIMFGDWGKVGHCIQVDREDGMYLAGRSLLPTHNSEMVSRKLPAFLIGRYPDMRIGTASYSSELAHTMAQSVRRNIASAEHQLLFPTPSIRSKFEISRMGDFTTPGATGSYIGVGVGAGLTGRPVDCGIIDDPVKDQQEALSEVTKESHWNWYQAVFMSRLSQNSGQIIMATSWAEDDLPARIAELYRDNDRLTLLRFPALNYPDETGYNRELPLGALVPDLKSEEFLREVKGVTSSYWWDAMYQQNPKSLGGNVFKESGIQFYLPKDLPENYDLIIDSWDCTFKDTDGTDYVVGQKWGKKGANSYLLRQTRDRMSFTKTALEVKNLRAQLPISREVLIEDKANGPAVIDFLKQTVHGIIPVEPDGSKLARAHAVTSPWEAGNIWLPHPDIAPWIGSKDRTSHKPGTFLSELTRFPAGANDDQVDAFTQAMRRLYPLFGRIGISDAALRMAARR